MKMTTAFLTTNCLPAIWRLAGGYLAEHRRDGEVRLWGPWDGEFGCWRADGAPVTPEWEPLTGLGRWHEPAGPRDDLWFASRAAITAYWSAVPTTVRLLASRLASGQWNILLEQWRYLHGAQD